MNSTISKPATTSDNRFSDLLGVLSPAKRQVALFLLQGASNKEIAAALGKTDLTVKRQVFEILRTYDQPSRSRLIAFFYKHAWTS